MAEPARAKPKPTPETQHFWDGTQAGELRLQRCDACANVYFPPRPFCPSCASRKVSVFKASGKGKLYSYVLDEDEARRLHQVRLGNANRVDDHEAVLVLGVVGDRLGSRCRR